MRLEIPVGERSVVLEPDPTAYRPVAEPETFPQRLAS